MISGKFIVINKPFCCIPISCNDVGEKKLMITTDTRLKKIIRGMEYKIVRRMFFGSFNTTHPSASKKLFFSSLNSGNLFRIFKGIFHLE